MAGFNINFDEIWDSVKERLPGMATNAANGVIESFFGLFSGFFAFFGKSSEVNKAKQTVIGLVSETTHAFTKSVDPDLAVVQSGSIKAVNDSFDRMKTGFSLSDDHFNKLKQSALDVVNAFYKDGVPALDSDQHLALAAPQAIEEYRKSIVKYLTGGEGKAGALPLNDPTRAEKAERIATLITGMTTEDTWQTLATKQSANGLVGSLASAQRARYAENYTKGSLTQENVAITTDTELLASTVTIPKATGGISGDNPTAPPGAKRKPNQVG